MEYKPCPFCGGDRLVQVPGVANYGESEVPYGVRCRGCGGEVGGESVGADWNTRPVETDLRAEIAALKARIVELEAQRREGGDDE